MMAKARKGEPASVFIILLLLVSIARLALVSGQELCDDPAVYAQVVREMAESPSIVPTYLGNPIAWKPPVAFYIYAVPAAAAWALVPGIGMETALRIGPALASIACAFVLFGIGRRLWGAGQGFAAAVVFLTSNAALSIAHLMFLDTALLLFILLAIYSYIRSAEDGRWLAAAFAFSALGGLVKGYAALAAPMLGIAYYIARGKPLRTPAFAASLLGVPLAMAAYAGVFALVAGEGGRDIFASYLYDAVARIFISGPGILSSATDFFMRMFPWLLVAPAGAALLAMRRHEDRFLAMWAAVSVLFLLGAKGYWWYCLPVVPVVALLCARAAERMRAPHAFAVLSACLLLSFASYGEFVPSAQGTKADEIATGKFLSTDCGSTLIATRLGVPAVILYKFAGSECRNYSAIRQMVAEPHGPSSYIAYESYSELVSGKTEKNQLINATPEYVGSLVQEYETAVLGKEFYSIYEGSPLPGYYAAYFSPNGEFAVLRRRAG